VYFSQRLYDASAMSDLRAERHSLAAAEYAERSARDVVVLVASGPLL